MEERAKGEQSQNGRRVNLNDYATASWPTPSARDHKSVLASAETMERNARPLSEVTTWATPLGQDDNKSPEAHMAMKARMKGGPRNSITSLQVQAKAVWATPTNGDSRSSGSRNLPGSSAHAGNSLTDMARGTGSTVPRTGAKPNGSGASSTSVGGALNPAFVCWLQGYPEGWLD
jgi:hypothetical protein